MIQIIQLILVSMLVGAIIGTIETVAPIVYNKIVTLIKNRRGKK